MGFYSNLNEIIHRIIYCASAMFVDKKGEIKLIAAQLTQLLPNLQLHGRTVADEEKQMLFFNWTCSGFTVHFTGKVLKAELCAIGELPLAQANGSGEAGSMEMPWIAVIADDGESIARRIECKQGCAWYTLWESQSEREHTLRIVKLSENARGKVGLRALETDGKLLPVCLAEKKISIEFVGDSITCGYGDEAKNKDDPFVPQEENGWITYAATAARMLDANFSCISISGVSVSKGKTGFAMSDCMEDMYEYTDYLYDIKCGKVPRHWDFNQYKNDIVMLNLGTNDVNPVRFAGNLQQAMEEEIFFCERYHAFLHKLRRLNGPEAWICCTLGPLDYYLFDKIQQAVKAYKTKSGDERICCFKYVGVNLISEGFGAVGHPSAKTHVRMGKELVMRLHEEGILPIKK